MSSMNEEFEESKSDLESLGLQTTKLNPLNDSYEIQHLVDNLKQQFIRDYKSTSVFAD
jgi:hypothetical protein